jgi:hypothetical protein
MKTASCVFAKWLLLLSTIDSAFLYENGGSASVGRTYEFAQELYAQVHHFGLFLVKFWTRETFILLSNRSKLPFETICIVKTSSSIASQNAKIRRNSIAMTMIWKRVLSSRSFGKLSASKHAIMTLTLLI